MMVSSLSKRYANGCQVLTHECVEYQPIDLITAVTVTKCNLLGLPYRLATDNSTMTSACMHNRMLWCRFVSVQDVSTDLEQDLNAQTASEHLAVKQHVNSGARCSYMYVVVPRLR
jgi:hypothetical protein